MNIGMPLLRYVYIPEAYAYKKYLSNLGWKFQLDYVLDLDNNVNIKFMSTPPFFKQKEIKYFYI